MDHALSQSGLSGDRRGYRLGVYPIGSVLRWNTDLPFVDGYFLTLAFLNGLDILVLLRTKRLLEMVAEQHVEKR